MKWREWVFANRHRGEVVARINGRRRRMRLSLQALAQLENCYGDTDILTLLDRFKAQGLSPEDADNILRAALLAMQDALSISGAPLDVEGGVPAARHCADRLLMAAFALPDAPHPTKKENGI